MFANLTGLYRHADLVAVLSAMLIVLAILARAPMSETGSNWHLTTASACASQTACDTHQIGA